MDTHLKPQDFDVPVFQEPGFAQEGVFHGFFGRRGGVSAGVYESLNCGLGTKDDPQNVAENRARVAAVAGVAPENLLSLYQVHGNACVYAAKPWLPDESRPKNDGLVTDKPGIGLGILTADCAPVLFYGQKTGGAPVIGAAHAGWKGALDGILETTVAAMKLPDVDPETIRVCIGPCIGKASYEVQEAFTVPFLNFYPESERFFHPARAAEHLMFDLAGFCAWRLACAGLKNVYIMDKDTYALEEDFFSYRRATHRSEADYARQISVIAIQPEDKT